MAGLFASFEEALLDYLAEMRRQGKAEGTIELYQRVLHEALRFLLSRPSPPVTLSDVAPSDLSAFRDHQIARERKKPGGGPLSANTLASHVVALRGFFRHLARRGVVLIDPGLDLVPPRRPRKLPRHVPTAREMKKLVNAPESGSVLGKRDRAVLELLWSTGLRNAEACALKVGDVDVGRRLVFVWKGKGGKERVVPMGKVAARAMAEYLAVYPRLAQRAQDPEMSLFLQRTGRPLRPSGLRALVEKSLKRSGLPGRVTPHSFRHACATHLLKGGAGIRQIQVLLGHASLESTEIYTKLETSDLRVMLDRHHPRKVTEEP